METRNPECIEITTSLAYLHPFNSCSLLSQSRASWHSINGLCLGLYSLPFWGAASN